MPDTIALRRRIKELQAEVANLRVERDIAQFDRQYAVTELAHAYHLTRDPGDTPTVLVHALRSVSDQAHQRVHLTASGHDLYALVDGTAYDADPGAEAAVWDWVTRHAETPPEHPFTREGMPARLYGVAWPGGQVTISAALSGRDAADARRALRPRRAGHALVRALGLIAFPSAAAGRAALGVLRDAQAATTAAASTATAAAGSALPAVTAAAISCTAVTSCAAAPLSINSVTGDHHASLVRVVDRVEPGVVIEPIEPPTRKPACREAAPVEVEREDLPAPPPEPDPVEPPADPATPEPAVTEAAEPTTAEPPETLSADPPPPGQETDAPEGTEPAPASQEPAIIGPAGSPPADQPPPITPDTTAGQPADDGSLLDDPATTEPEHGDAPAADQPPTDDTPPSHALPSLPAVPLLAVLLPPDS